MVNSTNREESGYEDQHEKSVNKEIEISEQPSTVTSKLSSGILGDEVGDLEDGKLRAGNPEQNQHHYRYKPFFVRLLLRCIFLFVVGVLAVSYWRGLWGLFDIYTCEKPSDNALFDGTLFCFGGDVTNPKRRNSALTSWGIGLVFVSIGKLLFSVGWFDDNNGLNLLIILGGTRILMVHAMGCGGVFIWRGLWMLTDAWMYPEDSLKSGWLSTILGITGCLLLCCSASLCAAPTGILQDPARETFETIRSGISSQIHRPESESPTYKTSLILSLADLAASYILLPIVGVWSWRGIWALQDYYLWGYTTSSSDFAWSLWIGSVIFSLFVTLNRALEISIRSYSRDRKIPTALLLSMSRLQNVILGVASVSFWRAIWYAWEYLAGPSALSEWVSHVLGLVGLVLLGTLADVTFPPAVDLIRIDTSTSQTEGGLEAGTLKVGLRWCGIAR